MMVPEDRQASGVNFNSFTFDTPEIKAMQENMSYSEFVSNATNPSFVGAVELIKQQL